MIDLYTWATPNGRKISIALEEMGLPYSVHCVDIRNEEQFADSFLKISPNNKIPAIYDPSTGASVFESAAILIYLAEKTGQFLPTSLGERTRVLEWLSWQMGGLGPMLGQLNHFVNIADEKVPYAMRRYFDEAARLFRVLDQQMEDKPFVAADYSIADMAIYPWSLPAIDPVSEQTDQRFENVERWHASMAERAAVQAGMQVPTA
ncbi:glutathione S-transferase N-terminal domain-containing protein [Erythrobacter sp. Alg231-14]|uniref:glutathione S-transferase N-terminal domain-containing protein n=1 Tax=Erythrobacter sp. Alg231-14 TaxID=1922225 RepID=UPI000D555135